MFSGGIEMEHGLKLVKYFQWYDTNSKRNQSGVYILLHVLVLLIEKPG